MSNTKNNKNHRASDSALHNKADKKEKMRAETIPFETEDGVEELYILEQTTLQGSSYILVSDLSYQELTAELPEEELYEDVPEDEEGIFLVLKDVSKASDQEAVYEIVEDEKELEAVIHVFNELLEDIDLEGTY